MELSLIDVNVRVRLLRKFMLCFNTFVGILALVGTGLISAGLVLLFMSLGMPDEKKTRIKPRPLWKNDHNK